MAYQPGFDRRAGAPKTTSESLIMTAQAYSAPVVQAATATAGWMVGILTESMDRVPPLKAFVYSLAASSSLPLAVYAGFTGFTGAIISSVAATIVTVIQGTIMAIGGFFLFWWLVGAWIVASISTFIFSGGYLVYNLYLKAGDVMTGRKSISGMRY